MSDIGLTSVKAFSEWAKAGTMPVDEATKKATTAIPNMQYGGSDGYFTNVTSEGLLLMNPLAPEREGMNLLRYQDANGVHLYQSMIDIVKQDGRRFACHSFSKPNINGGLSKYFLF